MNESGYDYRVDIWSLGIILFKILFNELPFKGNSETQIMNNIKL